MSPAARLRVHLFLFTIALGLSLTSNAADKVKRRGDGKVTHITFAAPDWNVDSRRVDSGSMILRDKTSGKLVLIQLEETEPDSGIFTGQFSVTLSEQLSPEVYIPPKELRESDLNNKKLYEMIQSDKLPRKPTLWKTNENGQSVLEVFSSREEAEAGLKAYQVQQRLADEAKLKKKSLGTGTAAALTDQAAARKAQLDKLATAEAQRSAERARLEQLERQKVEERERQMRAMSEAERAERRTKASKFNDQAMVFYNAGNYKSAEPLFKEAVSLDPDNKEYYYSYGITLYRNQKYNDALVALRIAKVDAKFELERKYYMGLVYYKLTELDNALKTFSEVGASSDQVLGPSSTFYVGIIQFAQEKYEPSKKAFEKVIDTSSDPKLDAQAEEYIDRIAGAMAYQKMRENKWTFTGVLGLMYDSNVLLSPDSSTTTATNVKDERLLTILDLQYRPVFNEKWEWSPHVMGNLTNSSKTKASPADPYIVTIASPVSEKGTIGKKANKFTATPGYELLYMDPYSTGTKQKEEASYYLTLDDTLVMSKTWFSSYTLEYRYDNSYDVSSAGDGDLDSRKYTLRTTQTMLLDKKKALLPTLGYIRNVAKGKDKLYNRYDLGVTYVAPLNMWKDSTWSAGLAYYTMKYPNATDVRKDDDYSLTAGINKPIREWVTWGLTGTYTKNKSNITADAYSKYMILTTATFTTNF